MVVVRLPHPRGVVVVVYGSLGTHLGGRAQPSPLVRKGGCPFNAHTRPLRAETVADAADPVAGDFAAVPEVVTVPAARWRGRLRSAAAA